MIFNFQLFREPSKAVHLYDGDSWMLGEHIPGITLQFAQVWLHAFTNEMHYSLGRNYKKVISFHREYDQHFYYGKKDCHAFCLAILDKLKADPGYGEEINANITKWSNKLVETAKEIHKAPLEKLSGKELWELYKKNNDVHLVLYRWGWLPNAVDMFYPELTNYLKSLLLEKVEDESKLSEYFVKLTAADEETIATQEHRSLLHLIIEVQKAPEIEKLFRGGSSSNLEINAEISKALKSKFEKHCKAFRHLKFMYHGTPANINFYFDQVHEYLLHGKDAAKELEELDSTLEKTAIEKKKLIKELNLDSRLQRLLAVYAKFMVTKWYRRNSQILNWFYLDAWVKEVCRRLQLTPDEVRTMLWEELEDYLVKNKKPDANELRERFKFCCFYTEKGKRFLFTSDTAKKLEAQAAKVEIDKSMQELKGQCACLGKATGTVKVILGPGDMHKMNQGDVLVSIATDPDIVPAMKKAVAIITEQGGVTSHAAIVSRELKIPCVIGTKIATKWLKDGDVIEVDATNGVIRKL